MKPRFSLRLLLIAIALLAIVLYICFVRPTNVARRFVADISQGDYGTARGMLHDIGEWDRVVHGKGVAYADKVSAQLMPREWQDVYRCQRRLSFHVWRYNNWKTSNFIVTTEAVATPRSVYMVVPANANLISPVNLPTPPTIRTGIDPGERSNLERKIPSR